MAFSEVHTALRQGMVDGTENPISNLYTKKMHEVQKHLTLSQHGYLGYAVIVNKVFWEGLPEEIRLTLEQVIKETTAYERGIVQQEEQAALDAVKKAGTTQVHLLSLEDRRKWWRALLPVHKAFEPTIGKDLIQATYRVAKDVEQDAQARGKRQN
jgi:C4-dicarboxylate-binding protein DctP